MTSPSVAIGLNAVIVAMRGGVPHVLTLKDSPKHNKTPRLPFGLFDPSGHRTMELGMRALVAEQVGRRLGYVEQLYTFGDRGRMARAGARHIVSVGYLALTRVEAETSTEKGIETGVVWRNWYDFLPYEDAQNTRLLAALRRWAGKNRLRAARVRLSFGGGRIAWDEEKALERYELLYEAGLVGAAGALGQGMPMAHDHRRILATAMSRLRAKLKYRPVIFELMPNAFTLLELQRAVEAISGVELHKPNFRRLVETARLVEPTGRVSATTGGRPAALFRFRRDVLLERPAPGLNVAARRG